jgi:hypothetical protein
MKLQKGGEARGEEDKSRHQWKEEGDTKHGDAEKTGVILMKRSFISIPLLLLLLLSALHSHE